MLIWVHGVKPRYLQELEGWAGRGYPRLLGGTPFADVEEELPEPEFLKLAASLSRELFAIARRHGATLQVTIGGRTCELERHYARAAVAGALDSNGVLWAMDMALEQAVRAAAKQHATFRVAASEERALRDSSELTRAMLSDSPAEGVRVLPTQYGLRSRFAYASPAVARRLLADSEEAPSELLELIRPIVERKLTLVVRRSSEDRSYE